MSAACAQEATELLQGLVRINTVNPPGNERPAQEQLAGLLEAAGLEVTLVSAIPSDRTWSRACAAGRTVPCSVCSRTWTRWSWTRPAGATIRGRGRSPTAACGAAGRST